jgi:two-component sensor histidine kinase
MRDELNHAAPRVRDFILPMIAGCGAYAVFRMAQTVLAGRLLQQTELSDTHRIILSAVDGALMAAMTPVAVWTTLRFPVDRRRVRNVAVHFAFGVLLSAVAMAVLRAVGRWLTGLRVDLSFPQYYLLDVTSSLLAYAVVVAGAHAIIAARRAQTEALRASRLDAQLSRARLEALKIQLQPHFLFNTLHTISELVHSDADAADAMLMKLGHLLRRTLDASMLSEITIDDELAYIGAYLDIHRVRHQERLRVVYDIDPAARTARIPPLMLQPLVENALRHGIAASRDGGTITVAAHATTGVLTLSVADDSAGLTGTVVDGVGLTNTRERLHELFGDAGSLVVRRGVPGGTEAILTIPIQRGR